MAAARPALFNDAPSVELSPDKTVALVSLPTKGEGTDTLSNKAVDALRADIVPNTVGNVAGANCPTCHSSIASYASRETGAGPT